MYYVTAATKAVNHGDPCVENGVVGVAVKQKAPAASAGTGTPQKQVAIGEPFAIISKGIVQVANGISAVKGSPVYIVAATNVLTLTSGNPKFGLCVEIAGQRGTPTAKMRVDLDKKDSFV
jgi:hypothetical protein